jgi:predicted proteasome-type protease
MNTDKKVEVYSVWVMRRDQSHITVLETSSFEEADKVYNELESRWTTALKEQVPFKLRAPYITAFDPGLIYEISLLPLGNTTKVNSDNPYQQQMRQNGFSNTFGNSARGSDVLDGGYKF